MSGRCGAVVFAAAVIAIVPPATASAAQETPSLNIRAVPLSQALSELARQAKVEMLFDEDLVRNLRAPAVRGRLSVRTALSLLLTGTGLGYRATPDGAFILYRLPLREPSQESDGAIAEILVIGRRTQNADIRRTENDIQPYKVSTSHDIQTAHRDDVDGFLRARVPANADTISPTLDVLQCCGATNSRIDLRGLGAQRTLVLLDGRRLPSLPSAATDFDQGDLNGVPLGAVDRIETLTSTAGGIYGPGAIGGVVNVVLRRDYRGADFTVTSGISDRGDAARLRLEARIGFTPDGGDTDVMLFGSYATSERLRSGQRDFQRRSRIQSFHNSQLDYIAPQGVPMLVPVGNAILVQSLNGAPLTFDPEWGGASLNSSITSLPVNFHGSAADLQAALVAHAGLIELDPPAGVTGDDRSLMNNPTVISALFNVRHRFGPDVEAFVDGLYFSNHGRARVGSDIPGSITSANSLNNPFAQDVTFRFPTPSTDDRRSDIDLYRIVGGVIVTLPAQWQASAELAIGAARMRMRDTTATVNETAFFNALGGGRPGPAGQPAIMPLGDWTALQAALPFYLNQVGLDLKLVNHFTDATIRFAGPLARLAGGPLSLTLLAEQRREHVPLATVRQTLLDLGFDITTPQRTQLVRSAYAELRAPLISRDAGVPLIRGLELGLAARLDSTKIVYPENLGFGQPSNDRLISTHRDALMFTLGAKFFPLPFLMLRGSFATGQVPPMISELQTREQMIGPQNNGTRDPKRGGTIAGVGNIYLVRQGGSHDIRQEYGSTLSLGAVINPDGRDGPRISVDYSRIRSRREVMPFPLAESDLLAAESSYPDRVIRGPLTDADKALGYTGGPILELDLRNRNTGDSLVEAVDFELDWRLKPLFGWEVAPYLRATWQPRVRTRTAPGEPWLDRVGYIDGPLAWRGNAGVEWRRGSTAIDLNAQYFNSYRVTYVSPLNTAMNPARLRFQGRSHVPSQVYVDLAVSRRFDIAGLDMEARLGVQNILDHSPPIIADPDNIGYSGYGDPRRRRVELAVTTKF